jgi:beta-lactamase class A
MFTEPITRRALAAFALGGLCGHGVFANSISPSTAKSAAPDASHTGANLAAVEARCGGRLGVFAVNTASGSRIGYHANELFPMCSVHKFLTVAAILSGAEKNRFRLEQHIPYNSDVILEYAPVTRMNLPSGFMTVEALCEAAIRASDNTADNLLLKLLGGPSGWTHFARSIKDDVSRLDRYEPELNSSLPGDFRDTTSPRAMTRTLATIFFGNILGDESRARLTGWMSDNALTKNLIRSGLTTGWQVADKSGSGSNGTLNDVAVIFPPHAAPILVAVFLTGSSAQVAERERVVAECARIIVCQLT